MRARIPTNGCGVGSEVMPLSVIGAGMGRTGTKSLQSALEMLGYAPCCHLSNVLASPALWPAWTDIVDGRSRDWERVFGSYSAAVDAPTWFYFQEIAAFYPRAKVILTVRDPDQWFESTQKTVLSNATDETLKGAPAAPLKIVHGAALRAAGDRMHDRQFMTGWFEEHNSLVKRSIPAERLLVYEVERGWEPLCNFLNVPVPSTPFPRLNQRAVISPHPRTVDSGNGFVDLRDRVIQQMRDEC